MKTRSHKLTVTTIVAAITLLVLVSAREFTAYAREIGFDDKPSVVATQPAIEKSQSGEFEVIGVVESLDAQTLTVNGQAIAILAATEVKSALAVGDTVKVHVVRAQDGSLAAREIELSATGFEDNGNTNTNANGNEAGDDNSASQSNPGQNANSNDSLNDNSDDTGNSNDGANLNGDDHGLDNGNHNNNDNGDDHGGKSGKG